jgi:hypothetical protein
MKFINYWKHFKTIIRHKWYVFIACAHCGLIWRGLVHDLSKFSFKEFIASVKYFQGNKSPIDAEKIEKGYSIAWQHHISHNTHHWHAWLDVTDGQVIAIKMPIKDLVEMICDWIGAGKAYNPEKWTKDEPYNYFMKNKNNMILHPDVSEFLRNILYMMYSYNDGLKKVYKILSEIIKMKNEKLKSIY